jgi:hypothetical protein
MSDTARFWWRVSTAVIVGIVGIGLGLHEMGTWTLPGWLSAALLIAGVLVAFVTATEAAIDQSRHGRVAELREQARAVLAPLLLEIEEATGIGARQLGVAAYRIRKPVLRVPSEHAATRLLMQMRELGSDRVLSMWRGGRPPSFRSSSLRVAEPHLIESSPQPSTIMSPRW